jgi:hypothetical protein
MGSKKVLQYRLAFVSVCEELIDRFDRTSSLLALQTDPTSWIPLFCDLAVSIRCARNIFLAYKLLVY